MAKPNVNTNPVANQYTARDERIIEIHNGDNSATGHKGLLVSLARAADGTFRVHLYRLDPGVVVTVEEPNT